MKNIESLNLGKTVAVICPHDDDGIIGCGGLLNRLSCKIKLYVIILTDGSLGYSQNDLKGSIIEIRKEEAKKAYSLLGAKTIFLDFPDMSLHPYRCWKTPGGKEGGYLKLLKILRKIQPDTLFIPNPLDRHPDHKAGYDMASVCSFQLQEPVAVEFEGVKKLENILIYKVWDNLKKTTHFFKIEKEEKNKKHSSLLQFKSQEKILGSLNLNMKKEEFQKV